MGHVSVFALSIFKKKIDIILINIKGVMLMSVIRVLVNNLFRKVLTLLKK